MPAREIPFQDHLHLGGPVLNENAESLVQKAGKMLLKLLKYEVFLFPYGLSVDLAWCFLFAI